MNLVTCVRLAVNALTAEQQKRAMSPYQSKVFVSESVISGRMWVIARMLSIGF